MLIGLTVGITIAIMLIIVTFSVFPSLIGAFTCPAITGDTDHDYVRDAGENWTESANTIEWSKSCNNLSVQTAIFPVLIAVSVIIGLIMLVSRLFVGGTDDDYSPVLPRGDSEDKPLEKPVNTAAKKKAGIGSRLRWFLH